MKAPSPESGRRFAAWLQERVISAARGADIDKMPFAPSGQLWLGRLAPEEAVRASALGERAERLDPCEAGFRVRLGAHTPRHIECIVRARVWHEEKQRESHGAPAVWRKSELVEVHVDAPLPRSGASPVRTGASELSAAFARVGAPDHSAVLSLEVADGPSGPELTITVVNTSRWSPPKRAKSASRRQTSQTAQESSDDSREDIGNGDTSEPTDSGGGVSGNGGSPTDSNLYEVELAAEIPSTVPFELDNLPGSFRYDRRVAAYGVNGGVSVAASTFTTTDSVIQDQMRPQFWDDELAGAPPVLTFERLAEDPLVELRALAAAMRKWGASAWSPSELSRRATADGWDGAAVREANDAAAAWGIELANVEKGLACLDVDADLNRAFRLTNLAFHKAPALKHKAWRPFQVGFLLTQLPSLVEPPDPAERNTVDILRFPTGGGKTETYLGLLVLSAFYDRMRGKLQGVTGWARFPLRMLSLQQTQRFADVVASAELIRSSEHLHGAPFSVGFLVGEPGTPNDIPPKPRPGKPDPDDASWPRKYQVLVRCPYCGLASLSMRFDKPTWRLQHECSNQACPWKGPLPFYIVDQEVFRFLPTVIVGTLDKAAVVSTQAAMRGLYGAPLGICKDGHGFTYAKRSGKAAGCLFPGCTTRASDPLKQDARLYPPSVRIQDELHLLRDSLGAIDAHYEALLDHLQQLGGSSAKVFASSATIAGYENQVDVLYRREARVFPQLGPYATRSFWAQESTGLARAYVGVAPRGLTLDYASDKTNEQLQIALRRALGDPAAVAREAGVKPEDVPDLVGYYGVGVVYGSTLKDVEAAARSLDTEIGVPVNSVTLTGRTPLEEVRAVLERLSSPEDDFERRIHVIAASSMLSHGVDIDRLNVMVMLGLPLATAEFIQTTSRVGRAVPGLVFVMHKIGRERDAKVFRTFAQFVQHADRLVDPVPITRRSRRVLELTFPGIELGRIYGVHEPAALSSGLSQLTTPANMSKAIARLPITEQAERDALVTMLAATGVLDEGIREDIETYLRVFFRNANGHPSAQFTSELLPREPMRSLRDVEESVNIYSSRSSS